MPQSEPAAETNSSVSRTSVEKMHDDRPCGTSFCSAIASSSVAVAQDVEDRREGLVAHDGGLRRHLDDGRMDVVAAVAGSPGSPP